jgi:hypothetical protein
LLFLHFLLRKAIPSSIDKAILDSEGLELATCENMRKIQSWCSLYCMKDLFVGGVVQPFLLNEVDKVVVLCDIVLWVKLPLLDLPL